jgi:hypothetical protein
MITELTGDIKTAPNGTWRLCAGQISNRGVLQSKQRVWTGANEQELQTFLATLPKPEARSQRAAAYFATLSADLRAKFQILFIALSAQTNDAQKLLALRALTPANDAETKAKADLTSIFTT